MGKEQKSVVAKIGTDTLLRSGKIDTPFVAQFAEQVWQVRDLGRPVVLLSSGAQALGGQEQLTAAWRSELAAHGIVTRQVLFREGTFGQHLEEVRQATDEGMLPLVNGDSPHLLGSRTRNNDHLATHIGLAIGADVVYLTAVDGVLDRNGQVIRRLSRGTDVAYWGTSTNGTGGMSEKSDAAFKVVEAGHDALIANGRQVNVLVDFAEKRNDIHGTSLAA